jgi:hypothetical protein
MFLKMNEKHFAALEAKQKSSFKQEFPKRKNKHPLHFPLAMYC